MKLKNCNFETWTLNHTPEHKDRIFRELYPYKVFQLINFSKDKLNQEQLIEFNRTIYFVEILKMELQDNGRYRTTFELNTSPKSKTQGWKNRSWNEKIQIVYTQTLDFITVFTKKEDSSKDYLKRFFSGSFDKITLNKSIPVSDLLFRTLVLNISEDLFGEGKHYEEFSYTPSGIRDLPEHPQFKRKKVNFFAPLYSKGRDIWVCHSFNEEKAHRIGFYNGNQTHELYVVFCNPTYTRHHRCNYENVHIISLFEFVYRNSKKLYGNLDRQIRFLQNHLNKQEDYSVDELLKQIDTPSGENYEIFKSELMEALGIMKIKPQNEFDLFHYMSAMNLLNAWINRNKGEKNKKEQLFRDMYYFKTYLKDVITNLIENDNYGAKIYLEKDLAMVEIKNFQFSFHSIPISDTMNKFMNSENNLEIKWSGKRLQPIASLIFRYAKELNKNASA